jgi:hypothetical protein
VQIRGTGKREKNVNFCCALRENFGKEQERDICKGKKKIYKDNRKSFQIHHFYKIFEYMTILNVY